MAEYGQFCPVAKASDIIGERWTVLILRELFLGTRRYNEFQRGLSRISPTLLSKRLKSLEKNGLIVRKSPPGQKSHEYYLTESGRELEPLIEHLAVWGMRWARGQLDDNELDVEFLMRDLQRRLHVVQLHRDGAVLRTQAKLARHFVDQNVLGADVQAAFRAHAQLPLVASGVWKVDLAAQLPVQRFRLAILLFQMFHQQV